MEPETPGKIQLRAAVFALVGVPERFSEKVLEVSESTPKVQNVR